MAAQHAAERARLEGLGLTAPFVDGQIAATAQVHGLVLVTRNIRDFEPFDGLRVENWLQAWRGRLLAPGRQRTSHVPRRHPASRVPWAARARSYYPA